MFQHSFGTHNKKSLDIVVYQGFICLILLPRYPEYSGEPTTYGLIPSPRDRSNQNVIQ